MLDGRPMAATAGIVGGVVALALSVQVTHDVLAAEPPAPTQPGSIVIDPRDAAAAAAAAAPETTAAPTTTAPPTTAAPTTTTAPPAPGAYAATTAIGDSVLVGAGPVMAARMGASLRVDALIGRQMADAPELIRGLAARGELGNVVLLHLGNNGPFTAAQIDEVFAAIGPDRRVLLVNVLVPRRWEGEVNDALAAAAARHPNAVLVDWRSLVTSEPGLTREDGYHLTAVGAERYADLVVGQVPRV
jgi:hypothetical protein